MDTHPDAHPGGMYAHRNTADTPNSQESKNPVHWFLPLTWRYLGKLPQDRKVARVFEL